MSLEREIASLQKQYELTNDRRYKKAAKDIAKIKNRLPAEYARSDNSLLADKPDADSVDIFPLTHKTSDNAILDQDIQIISEREKRKAELMEELCPLIEFHSAEFARRVPQEKSRNPFKLRDKSPKVVQWALHETPDERGDDFHITYLSHLTYDFDKRLGKNVPTKATLHLESQHDRQESDSSRLKFAFKNGQIVDANLEWKFAHPNVISEIGKSSKMKGDIFQTTIKALEGKYALNHFSVMDKNNYLADPLRYISHIKIASRIPSELTITYRNNDGLFINQHNTSVSTYVYRSGKDKLDHFKTSTTQCNLRDRTNLKPFFKDEIEKDEYLGIVKGMFGLIPTIQATKGY